MRRVAIPLLLGAAVACGRAEAQEAPRARGPELQVQPGLLSADFLSAPEGVPSTTGFNLRFATRVPTRHRWLLPVVGASVTPEGTSGASQRNTNAPALFAGNVFPLVRAERTAGWLTLELPLLVYHAYGGGGARNPRIYGRDLYVQLAAYVHLGRKALRDLGPGWARFDLYAFVEQNLTPNENTVTGRTDRFNPVALAGVSLTFGPTPP